MTTGKYLSFYPFTSWRTLKKNLEFQSISWQETWQHMFVPIDLDLCFQILQRTSQLFLTEALKYTTNEHQCVLSLQRVKKIIAPILEGLLKIYYFRGQKINYFQYCYRQPNTLASPLEEVSGEQDPESSQPDLLNCADGKICQSQEQPVSRISFSGPMFPIFFSFLIHWSTVALQCCVSSCCTAE